MYHVRNFLKGLFLLLTFNVNSFADKVKLERPYELNPKEFSILKNQLYSCVDENKIFDDKFEGLEIQAYFFISQMRNVYLPEIINQSDSEVFFDNDGITIGNSTVKIANKIILDVFDNPDCQNLILPINKYDSARDFIFNFNFEEIQNFYKKKQNTSIIIVDLPGMKCAGDSYDGKLINGLAYCKEAFGNWYVQMNDSFISGVGFKELENGEKVIADFYGKSYKGFQIHEKNNQVRIERNAIEWGQHGVGFRFSRNLKNNTLQFDYFLDGVYTLFDFQYDMRKISYGSVEQYYFDKESEQYFIVDDSFALYYDEISNAYLLSDIITPVAFKNAHFGKINSEGMASGPVIEITNFGMNYFYVDEDGNWESVPTKDFRNLYGEEFDNQLEIMEFARFDIESFWNKVDVFLKRSTKIGLKLEPIIEEFSLSDEKVNQIKKYYSEYISKLN